MSVIQGFRRGGLVSIALFTVMAAACSEGGGGGGGSSFTPAPTPTPTPTPTGPTWTQGVYEPADEFINRCETVRTGVDIEGNPYPDISGSTLEENFWLRSWTNETYLWNDEVVDRDPANYVNPVSYFEVLKTTATTPSGKPKDDFHFSQSTEDYLEQRNSAPTASYGAEIIANSTTPPRDFRVVYNEPGTPASAVVSGLENLPRGARILEVDGVDLVNANGDSEIDTLNDGLFPLTAGETHTFVIQEEGASTSRSVTLTSANVTFAAVNRYHTVTAGADIVGYMLLNTFSPYASEESIATAMETLKADGVTELVIDLRYNGGGLLAVAAQLGYMIAGDAATAGRTFEALQFNDDAGMFDPVTGALNEPFPFLDEAVGFSLPEGQALESLDLDRVFILATDWTCSASEAVINGLRGIDVEVVLIGRTTCGKPYGFYPASNCGETYYSIQFQGVNDKGFGDYANGFTPANSGDPYAVSVPGCEVADDLGHALGDASEAMFAAALQYIDSATCPTPPVSVSSPGITVNSVSIEGPPERLGPSSAIMRNNRDMTMPQ